jgi:hypothetical protein
LKHTQEELYRIPEELIREIFLSLWFNLDFIFSLKPLKDILH